VVLISIDLSKLDETYLDEDRDIIDRYLRLQNQTGSHNLGTRKSIIITFLNYVRKPLHMIREEDGEDWLFSLNTSQYTRNTQQLYKNVVQTFFKDIESKLRRIDPFFFNPIGKFKFNQAKPALLKLPYTIEELKETLHAAYFRSTNPHRVTSKAYFCITLILTFCAPRISEVVSIKRADFHLADRYFETGEEPNARKSNRDGEKNLIFCFPAQLSLFFKEYLIELEETSSIWLFPGQNPTQHLTAATIQAWFRQFEITTHRFRHTLISFFTNEINDVPDRDVHLLTNHVPTGVVAKHYTYRSIAERREKYDRYLPKEYAEVLTYLSFL
jgi:integrase